MRGEISGPPTESVYSSQEEQADPPYVYVTFDPTPVLGLSRSRRRYQAYTLQVTAGDSPVLLSAADDDVVIRAGDETVGGIMDMAATDPAFLGDELDGEQQATLRYPGDVQAYETVTIYVLAPPLTTSATPDWSCTPSCRSGGRSKPHRPPPASAA